MSKLMRIDLSWGADNVIYNSEKFKNQLNKVDEEFNKVKSEHGKDIQKDDILLISINSASAIEKYGMLAKTLKFIEEFKNSLKKRAIPMIVIAILDSSFNAFIAYSTVPEIEEYKFYPIEKILRHLTYITLNK